MATATPRTAARDSYLRLIEEFPLRRINSPAAHARAKQIALRLANARTGRGASEYLDVLVDLIADYERRSQQAVDASAVDPAELVRHRIAERGMSVSALARLIGIPQPNLSGMLAGKRDWSKAAIRAISKHLNIRPDRFFG